ncbi:MAG: squalene/phytoene synthase family protein [Elusimicrobia bacterium]|nr:squalene/phytoene synthase family protein [Elusimicrobiota bacterium]
MSIRWNDRFPSRLGFAEPVVRRGVRELYKLALAAEAASAAGEGKRLEAWRRWLDGGGLGEPPEAGPAAALAVLRSAGLPAAPLAGLVGAWREDCGRRGAATLAEFEGHARATSGAAGRLALRLAGIEDESTLALAETLWAARGMTAALQDTRQWLERGRVYLPADIMAEHGYSEADLRMGVVNDRFRSVMKEVWKAVRGLYQESRPLPRRLRWPLSVELRYGWSAGAALLGRISRDGFDVLHGRPVLARWEAPRLAAGALLPL